jgi:hypothetical protein
MLKKFSNITSSVWGVRQLAGTPHLADDLPNGVTDTTGASSGWSSLSLFVLQGKMAPNFRTRHSTLSYSVSSFILLFPV